MRQNGNGRKSHGHRGGLAPHGFLAVHAPPDASGSAPLSASGGTAAASARADDGPGVGPGRVAFPWGYLTLGTISGLIFPPLAIVFFVLGGLQILVADPRPPGG